MPTSARILLVDDEEMNRDALSRRLLRQGYQVTLAASGAEALDLLKQQDFDLVLLDVMMPEVDGLHVLATVRETHSHTDLPVIMVTARDQGGDAGLPHYEVLNSHRLVPIINRALASVSGSLDRDFAYPALFTSEGFRCRLCPSPPSSTPCLTRVESPRTSSTD